MRAVTLRRHGGPEVLEFVEVPKPEPKRGEVRVRIRIIGINFAEVLSRRGVYGWAPKMPYTLGMEAFGEIDAIGEGVTDRRIGDRVIVGTQSGTYAEFLCVPSGRTLLPPKGFTDEECAAFAVASLTAWIGLMEMARLRTTDTVLVTSAAGGVGTAAIQIAKRFGARVVGAAGSNKQQRILDLGADLALDYDQRGWDAQLPPLNAVLELRGGSVYRAMLRHLAPMARVVIAGASEAFPRSRNPIALLKAFREFPRPNLQKMLKRSYGVMSFHVGYLLDSGAVMQQWSELVQFVEKHGIRPVVGQEFPFEQIGNAHRALEERRNVGKVLVRV